MTPTDFFKWLGAPLKNNQWSWGAARAKDGAVFLRVWQDESTQVDGRTLMRLTNREVSTSRRADLGYRERLTHLDLVRAGAHCYLIMCVARDPRSAPRTIESFE